MLFKNVTAMAAAAVVALGASAIGAFALISSATAATPAIETAKSSCIVGERNDGYLGVVDEGRADDALRREVASVNQQRKAAYARIAQRNGVSIEDTAVLTAERLINQAGPGECVQNASGEWVRK